SSFHQASALKMDIESVRCACCGLEEDCTQEYIENVKANFGGKWLCGLCSEAVGDELSKDRREQDGIEDAIKAHMAFCRMALSSPAVKVADGMKEMLRKRSKDKVKPEIPSKAHPFLLGDN
ncbi:Os05g0509800, partial [Oryza sativa Japonica Group]